MYHLHHKDYLFLVGIGALMIFVTLAFWFSWKGVSTPIQVPETSNPSQS